MRGRTYVALDLLKSSYLWSPRGDVRSEQVNDRCSVYSTVRDTYVVEARDYY